MFMELSVQEQKYRALLAVPSDVRSVWPGRLGAADRTSGERRL